MEYIRDPDVLRRMQIAFELAEAGEEMKRLTLKRQHPDATDEEIERMIVAWYRHRTRADLGDRDGVADPDNAKGKRGRSRRLWEALIVVDKDLRAMRVRWALIGGFAVAARAEPRTTHDLDLVLAVEGGRSEEDGVVRELHRRGYRDRPDGAVLIHKAKADLSTVRLELPGKDFEGKSVDLLFGSSGIEPEITAEAERLEILPGTFVPVARTGHLLALKILAARADRPQDYIDLQELLKVADEGELQRARQALDLISRRPGFDRGKDLLGRLEALIRDGYLSPDHA